MHDYKCLICNTTSNQIDLCGNCVVALRHSKENEKIAICTILDRDVGLHNAKNIEVKISYTPTITTISQTWNG